MLSTGLQSEKEFAQIPAVKENIHRIWKILEPVHYLMSVFYLTRLHPLT